jgi:hypothetical protein
MVSVVVVLAASVHVFRQSRREDRERERAERLEPTS